MADVSSVKTTFLNGGLNVANPDTIKNKATFVIGIGSKGRTSIPIRITGVTDITSIFGDFSTSPLSKKLLEVWNSSSDDSGQRAIYGIRIGGGQHASLELDESANATPNCDYALKLTSTYPGDIAVTIRSGINDNGQQSVIIYNPDTGIESYFSYDYVNLDNGNVDVHTVSELVTAINSDANLNGTVEAEYPNLNAKYELVINSGTTGISTENGYQVLTLSDLPAPGAAQSSDIPGSANLYTGATKTSPVAATNLLLDVTSIYEISTVQEQLILGEGSSKFQLTEAPILYPDELGVSTKLVDLAGNYPDLVEDSIDTYPEHKFSIRKALVDNIIDNSILAYTTQLFLPPDVYEIEDDYTGHDPVTEYKETHPCMPNVTGYTWEYSAESSGAGDNDSDHFILYYKPSGQDTYIPIGRSNYTISWTYDATNGGQLTVTFSVTLLSLGISEGDALYMDTDSIIGVFSELTTLQAINASSNYYEYFVTGRDLYFGANLPSNIVITFPVIRNYSIGENIIISDYGTGKIKFLDNKYTLGSVGTPEVISTVGGTGYPVLETHPIISSGLYDPTSYPQASNMDAGVINQNIRLIHRDGNSGSAWENSTAHDGDTRVGLIYTFEPEWPTITYIAQTLYGGTTGINITGRRKYEELSDTLSKIRGYQPRIVTLAGMLFDDTKVGYNAITGVEEDINAAYHILLNGYTDSQSTESDPCIGIMGVVLPETFNQESLENWVSRLTIYDSSDPTRAANVMYEAQASKLEFLHVVAIPSTISIGGTPVNVSTDGIIAGMSSALAPNRSLHHQALKGIINVPYPLHIEQSKSLVGANYVTYTYSPVYGYVIADDPSVRGLASDYNSISTIFSIHDAVAEIRGALVSFLSHRYEPATKDAMQRRVEDIIDIKKKQGIIRGGTAQIISSDHMMRRGLIQCKVLLAPAFGLKAIELIVKAQINV